MKASKRKSDAARWANQVIRGRTLLLMVTLGICTFLVLFWKLFDLQINRHEEMQERAVNQQTRSASIAASRGTIYDRNGNIIAVSATAETINISPREIADFVKAQEKANGLKARFVDVMDRDTEAFNVVSAAFGMPKATDEEKAARSAAIQKGLEGCTKTPFEMMELAVEALELTAGLLGKSNDAAASDLGVSALSLRAAIQGAWLNVLINIGSLKNKELAEDYRAKGEALLAKALPLADEIYEAVVKTM